MTSCPSDLGSFHGDRHAAFVQSLRVNVHLCVQASEG